MARKRPDLNPTENMWSILTHTVHLNEKQFSSVNNFKDVTENAWIKSEPKTIQNPIFR